MNDNHDGSPLLGLINGFGIEAMIVLLVIIVHSLLTR
jgi:hypothetical protein